MPKDGQQLSQGGRVAVVVPSYNHAPFVAAALRSVFAQRLAPARLLVIDDGSRDGSPRVIEDVLKDCPFPCELIARANRGLCATLNEGLARTEGAYFAYLGSDDLWLPGFLEARVALLEGRPRAVLAYGHAYLIDGRGGVFDCTLDWARYSDGDARAMLLEETYGPMSPTVLHRRQGLERHGWNERARLEAQRNAAPHLDLSPERLERYQRALNFAGAEDLLRLGDKRAALKYLRRGLPGAPGAAALARVALRLLTPYALVRRRNRRKQASAASRYGSLSDDEGRINMDGQD